jgi:hypothetical protein
MFVIILSCALSLAALDGRPQAIPVDEQAWNAFMQWLAVQPANGDPPKLLAGYRQELIRQGDAPDWGVGGKIRIHRLVAEKPVR